MRRWNWGYTRGMANGRIRGADSDTANSRTATDNATLPNMCLLFVVRGRSTRVNIIISPWDFTTVTCRHYKSTSSIQKFTNFYHHLFILYLKSFIYFFYCAFFYLFFDFLFFFFFRKWSVIVTKIYWVLVFFFSVHEDLNYFFFFFFLVGLLSVLLEFRESLGIG